MKYLALLSGGKDSCFNLAHCARNGHELVAAGSLGPGPGKEELDSYLYQTVGQDAIEFVARALEVPLYRKVITGTAVEQGSEYGERKTMAGGVVGDETEDLFELLSTVKVHHPDVKGVSVGAILSNYQRVRVEHVCRRLSLTPLCYLWERNQGELLSEMIDAGMEAVVIKVAGIGLNASHLGKTLVQMKDPLFKLNAMYGSHICGEGGEYESLTLDCPMFKSRIHLVDVETIVHSDNDFASVAFLRIKSARLERKATNVTVAPIPPLLDHHFNLVRQTVLEAHRAGPPHFSEDNGRSSPSFVHPDITPSTSRQGNEWVAVSNIQTSSKFHDMRIEDEVTACFHILAERLAEFNLTLSNCAHINIFLQSMNLFARVNVAYATFFGISPPSRACLAVDLPEQTRVVLDCVAFRENAPSDRQALHVQSLSYWAPANIGPYSQAIVADQHVFVSGQIGLIPSSLALPSPGCFATEFALSSQHAERVATALRGSRGGWVGHTQGTIYWLDNADNVVYAREGHTVLKYPESPTLFVVVKALPKGSLVEKQVMLHTGQCQIVDDEDGEITWQSMRPKVDKGDVAFEEGCALHWEMTRFEDNSSCTILWMKGDCLKSFSGIRRSLPTVASTLDAALSSRFFHVRNSARAWDNIQKNLFASRVPPTVDIPCRAISSMLEDSWDVALCVISL